MTDTQPTVDELHAEVVGMLDALRDKAQASEPGSWVATDWERKPNGSVLPASVWQSDADRHDDLPVAKGRAETMRHVSAWSPAAVLLLVGDDGLLRQLMVDCDHMINPGMGESDVLRPTGLRWLTDLRDTLRKMGADS